MSRHKKKYKHKYDNRNENNLDMSNIQSMLNGIDMNQLSNIMASLNKANNNNNYNNNNYNNDDDDDDETYNNFSNNNINTNQIKNDYTLQFLNMLRPMINPEKKEILDKLIQIYYVSKLIKK